MKISILTLPLHTNYGGILQAFALQTVLKEMGHEVEILQKIPTFPHSKWIMPAVYLKRCLYKILKNRSFPIFIEQKVAKEKPIVEQYTSDFIRKYLNIRYVRSLKEIQPKDYDAIVVGSDQVWRKSYFCPMWNAPIKDAFLDFTKDWDIKRIAYAASFGEDTLKNYSTEEIEICSAALKRFDKVSVREKSGVDICSKFFNINPVKVLDPTMLLSQEDYQKIITNTHAYHHPSGDLMCYILDYNSVIQSVINKIAKDNNLKVFSIGVDVKDFSQKIERRVQPPVESWIRGFKDSKFIITDSFHACVFAIIFGKPFLVVGNKDRGMSRFKTLLDDFNLGGNLYEPTIKCNTTFEFDSRLPDYVDSILKTLQPKSYSFLQDNSFLKKKKSNYESS